VKARHTGTDYLLLLESLLSRLVRHDHLRSVLATESKVWAGGMTNGPGTHSGDDDPSLIRADPFVATLILP
jgi:hypothetical protein